MNVQLTIFDYLFLYSLGVIWLLLVVNIFLAMGGYLYYIKSQKTVIERLEEYPFVSIMVPAHNEAIVITRTAEALLSLDYPADRYELIIINDNSSDNSAELLDEIKSKYPLRNMTIINTTKENGGKGKSNALNIGFTQSKGEYIAIYDADNTPEKTALRYLVETIHINPEYGAVIGKFRTRNRDTNILTRFVNIETLSFQWMAQAGRWQLFKLCTIPGTNFIMRRSIIEAIGGWDVKAIAEDTEISFRIYEMGYKIKFVPESVTWEQEPQRLDVWFKQRTRWAKGNIYVIVKNLKLIFTTKSAAVRFDVLYFSSVYFMFLTAILISDLLFLLGAFGLIHLNVEGSSVILWVLAYLLFVLEISVALAMEKGENNVSNLFIIMIMYFTYCQLWMLVAFKGFILNISDNVLKREVKWYKTERF